VAPSDYASLIEEFFRRFDADDIDGLLELFVDDCSFAMVVYGVDLHGKAEIADFFRMHMGNWREHREWATSILVKGDEGASELHFEGVTTSGQPVVMDNLNIWDFEGGSIRRIRVYADTAPMQGVLE
jgi:ketosteroid isomerase-like protein